MFGFPSSQDQQANRAIRDTLCHLLWQTFPDGTSVYANRRWVQYTGVEPDPRSTQWLLEPFLHPEDKQRTQSLWERSLKTQEPFETECRLRSQEGRYRWFLTRAEVSRDLEQQVTHWVGTCTDIQDHTTDHFRSLTEELPQIVWTSDEGGSVTFFNRQWYRYTGLPPGSLDAPGWSSVVHPDDLPLVIKEAQRMRCEDGNFQAEYRLRRFDGQYRWHLGRSITLRNREGGTLHRLGTATDIDDQKRMAEERAQLLAREQMAQEASQLKSQFLANMSHEIRTPMNGVIGMVDLMLGTPLTAEQKEYAEAISHSAGALLAVINDILDHSKVEQGKLHMENLAFHLRETVREVEKILKPQVLRKGLHIEIDICSDLPDFVRGDPGRLRQVLLNLLGNAVKFTPCGKLCLRVVPKASRTPSDEVLFEIIDTGVGLHSQNFERIFLPFVQADCSATRQYGGTGLGLSISKRLVELMHGQIGVRSEVGKGSTFWFTLPLPRAEEERLSVRKTESHPLAEKSPLRILVAEDNEVNQMVAVRMLRKMGYQADVAANGADVLKALEDYDYDLVLMDCQMPVMDGWQTTEVIRRSSQNKKFRIPIIALTAGAMKSDEARCLQVGMDDYLPKPITLEILAQKVAKWL